MKLYDRHECTVVFGISFVRCTRTQNLYMIPWSCCFMHIAHKRQTYTINTFNDLKNVQWHQIEEYKVISSSKKNWDAEKTKTNNKIYTHTHTHQHINTIKTYYKRNRNDMKAIRCLDAKRVQIQWKYNTNLTISSMFEVEQTSWKEWKKKNTHTIEAHISNIFVGFFTKILFMHCLKESLKDRKHNNDDSRNDPRMIWTFFFFKL